MMIAKPSRRLQATRVRQEALYIIGSIFFLACFVAYWLINQFANSRFLTSSFPQKATKMNALKTRMFGGLAQIVIFLSAAWYYAGNISLAAWRKLSTFAIAYFTFDALRSVHDYFTQEAYKVCEVLFCWLHHGIVAFILVARFYKYPKMTAQGLLSEFTTPVLYVCWALRELGKQGSLLFYFGVLCVGSGFLILRFYNFFQLAYTLYKRRAPRHEIVVVSLIIILNMFFVYQILEGLYSP